ncbi:Mg2+ transporter protein, CorA-like protein [Cordyceps fumosorosea ARSEF 2679]|uniref:Mg2+ transporter protein, CorA-like protein n=1 Tax=Cordyceps fumosorosea (strain ARSEF 2679) TaxID=1081104 RepID=A0A167MJQ0_CORFA|nr:Mg2+ transporter protein, CorA-like protein [Cordyceps fumosorosea ARSEF 2679]OAA54438.1 Mg2+ transporter protein, CorA-like protein [Cordyceps fumosorosea ARSEF 2679]
MSDNESTTPNTGFEAPVPELDDHRQPSISTQRVERPRRGTFDSLYGSRQAEPEPAPPTIVVRDFEEAVIDEDGADLMAGNRHGRRLTAESSESRSPSPPNSVKAFAQARRREREMSFSDPKADYEEMLGLGRALSVSSRRSHRSRSRAVEADAISLGTNNAVEDNGCLPEGGHHRQHQLRIDFDYLEEFIELERLSHEANRKASVTSAFNDLRTEAHQKVQLATSDGDIIDMPSDGSSSAPEKSAAEAAPATKGPQYAFENNRFSFFSSAWESTIHAAEFGDLVLPGEDIRGLFELPKDESDGVWWLNINRATKEEVLSICKAFGVHPLTIEDIVTQEAREKIELFPSYYFACFRSFNMVEEQDGIEYEPFNIYTLVFREGTLSFSFAPNSHASHVRRRITALKDYVALSSDWICYALIDDIVDCFAPVINQIETEADAIEDEVFVMRHDDSNTFLRSIGRVRKNCMALLRLLGGKADVLRGFTKRCNENYQVTPHMDIGMYLGDIQDHVVTMANNLGHCEKLLSRAHSNYLATLSINNISQGTDTNRVLSKITFLASVLVPLNLVSGMFGMNNLTRAMENFESSSLSRLNDGDKAELQKFLANEQQRSSIQSETHKLTQTCWKKCVTSSIKDSKLDRSEETCLANCVDRFLDLNQLTIKHLNNMRS